MKIKVLSDTHGFHAQEPVTEVDLLIHAGDAANPRDPVFNEDEFRDFYNWWREYPATHKIYVPGNHDSYLESPMSRGLRKSIKEEGDHLLIHSGVKIEDIRIFGSPYTPEFGNWSFMRKREKIGKLWEGIPDHVDILITHGPPKGILDLTVNRDGTLEQCGCSALLKRVKVVRPKYHIFGHIHGNSKFENNGILIRDGIQYMNCSQVVDGEFRKGLQYPGKIINL